MDDSDNSVTQREVMIFKRWLFRLGTVVKKTGAAESLTAPEIARALDRHTQREWGELEEHDWQVNRDAVEHAGRILSADTAAASGERFWVITEADRSATTALLPDEYCATRRPTGEPATIVGDTYSRPPHRRRGRSHHGRRLPLPLELT